MNVHEINWQPRIDLGTKLTTPDTLKIIKGELPSSDFVITKNTYGDVESVFADNIWQFQAYDKSQRSRTINFTAWISGTPNALHNKIIDELK